MMLGAFKRPVLRLFGEATQIRLYQVSLTRFNEVANTKVENDVAPIVEENSHPVAKRLMDFFDAPENWSKDAVKSGRSWRIDELRIKSNKDLHCLWYVLYKERNMLKTMEEASKEATQNMPSPERIDKVEESMKYIEEVIQERNRAYWDLEVGDSQFVSRRKAFRRDIFGRWRWIACSEHLIPYWMNTEWRKMNAPGFGKDVEEFNKKLREKQLNKTVSLTFRKEFHVRQLLKRFENIDMEYLQELYPEVNVQSIKENLNEITRESRQQRFDAIFYQKRKLL